MPDQVGSCGRTAVVLRRAIGLDPFHSVLKRISIVRPIEPEEYGSGRNSMAEFTQSVPQDSLSDKTRLAPKVDEMNDNSWVEILSNA